MEWFSRKTSIAGIQISNWMIVLGRRYHNVAHLHIHARSPNPTLRAGPIQNVPPPDVSLLDHSVSDGEQP